MNVRAQISVQIFRIDFGHVRLSQYGPVRIDADALVLGRHLYVRRYQLIRLSRLNVAPLLLDLIHEEFLAHFKIWIILINVHIRCVRVIILVEIG